MSERLYLTDALFYFKNKLYYQTDENDPVVKLNNKNWHKYLDGYGWDKLPYGWKRRLKSKDANFRYGLLDCGAQGDCLFHCIAEALNDSRDLENTKHDVQSLRTMTAEMITDDNFITILENYKCEEESGVFNGDWKPDEIKTKEELRDEIRKCGNNFWGDHILLQLIQERLKFNVIVMNSEKLDFFNEKQSDLDIEERFTIHPMACDLKKYDITIILYYEDGLHFQLVGIFDKCDMLTKFKYEQLPERLLEVYRIDCRI